MIKSLWIDNFKSLVDFELEFTKFNCLVGLNGSGKSTVLQSLNFISQLMKGDLVGWLSNRNWESADLNSKLSKKSNIGFKIVFELPKCGEVIWSGSFNRTTLRCTKERLECDNVLLLNVDKEYCFMPNSSLTGSFPIVFNYQGSILSQLRDSRIVSPIVLCVKEMALRIEPVGRLTTELFATKSSNHSLLFDEIENGIDQETLEYLIDRIVNDCNQVISTTHSPMVLNYLEDVVARQGIIYLYKNSQGMTRSIKLFDIPSMAEKLQIMGPGEAFADTELTHLFQEVEALKH